MEPQVRYLILCDEVRSDRFQGGLLYKRSAQMHMGRFAHGLAAAAERHGAQIHTSTCVERIERLGQGHVHELHTSRGTLRADQVLLATGATRHGSYGSFGWLRRRIVPIGSFIVVTEPLELVDLCRLADLRIGIDLPVTGMDDSS